MPSLAHDERDPLDFGRLCNLGFAEHLTTDGIRDLYIDLAGKQGRREGDMEAGVDYCCRCCPRDWILASMNRREGPLICVGMGFLHLAESDEGGTSGSVTRPVPIDQGRLPYSLPIPCFPIHDSCLYFSP
jgi:hypothetical protein